MAPRKRGRPAKKPTTTMSLLPDPNISDASLPPLRLTSDAELALLPWLAKGFAPVKTTGQGQMCGLHAIWRAFREAREALKDPGEKMDHVSLATFEKFLKGKEYKEMANRVVKAQSDLGFVADEEVFADLLAQKRNLDINQIGILLELANEEAGTDFALGYVTEGWRCRLNVNTNQYDNSYVSHSTAHLAGDLLGDTDQRPARPVIWIWNDSYNVKQEAWGQDSGSLNHWEGFGGFAKTDFDRRGRVQRWQVGETLKHNLEQGVWMVTEDRTESEENELQVIRGTFVKDAVPECIVPQGWRFVVACNDMRGLVPMGSLSPVQLDPTGSLLFAQSGGSIMEVVVQNPNTQSVEAHETYKPVVVQDSRSRTQETRRDIAEGKGNIIAERDHLELRFFRAIDPTGKMGRATSESFAIGDFDIKSGDILLDSTERHNGTPTVITANGRVGEAHFRRLQHIESAWGLPSKIRGILVNDRDTQKTKGNESGSVVATSQYQHSLPLYRLTKDYSAAEAQNETAFLKGEVVRGIGPAGDGGDFHILDFESKLGVVDFGALETFGHSGYTGEHDYPFGIQLYEDIPNTGLEERVKKSSADMPEASAEKLSPAGGPWAVQEYAPSNSDGDFQYSGSEAQEIPDASEGSAEWEEGPAEGEAIFDSPGSSNSSDIEAESADTWKKSGADPKSTKRSQDGDSEDSPKEKKQKT